jgi:hypothetical protein
VDQQPYGSQLATPASTAAHQMVLNLIAVSQDVNASILITTTTSTPNHARKSTVTTNNALDVPMNFSSLDVSQDHEKIAKDQQLPLEIADKVACARMDIADEMANVYHVVIHVIKFLL